MITIIYVHASASGMTLKSRFCYEVIAVHCNSVAVATMRPEGDSRGVARAQNLAAVIFRHRAARKEFKR